MGRIGVPRRRPFYGGVVGFFNEVFWLIIQLQPGVPTPPMS